MNINTVIDHLNKKYDINLDSSYYQNIAMWREWWMGYYAPFHTFAEVGLDGKKKERKLYTLKMAKQVCEDWASGLLNDELHIAIDDETSETYILGEKDDAEEGKEDKKPKKDIFKGVLRNNAFRQQGNRLIEKSFAFGTGAFVLRAENIKLGRNNKIIPNPDINIRIEYLSADHIIPLSVHAGKITEVVFTSEVLQLGEKMIYLETHRLIDGQYVITNEYFKAEEGSLIKQELPDGILEEMTTGGNVPLFSIVMPNIENNIAPGAPLGISVFANAIDNLEGVDLAYNNFNKDFKLGGKKVFMNSRIVRRNERGETITPDDVAQQLFVETGDDLIDDDGTKKFIQEHNPSLRVSENIEGVQAQLDLLSFKCGLGTKFYHFNSGTGAVQITATEYMGGRQDLTRNTGKHSLVVINALESLIRSILWVRKQFGDGEVDPETKIEIDLGDSFISDSASERAQDMQDVREGIMNKWEYRAKWYGESDDTAKANIPESTYEEDPFGFNQK